jgi:hypothetical protein
VIGAKRRWLRDAVTGQLIGLYGDGGLVCMLHAPCGRRDGEADLTAYIHVGYITAYHALPAGYSRWGAPQKRRQQIGWMAGDAAMA